MTGSLTMPHYNDLGAVLTDLRAAKPLVHCITNYVSMDLMANSLLALGASPAMVHTPEESGEFAALASAININIGTISPPWLQGMLTALETARTHDKPCVLDPVGVGASKYRQDACRQLLDTGAIDVIRGNASEIIACAQLYADTGAISQQGRGVDSSDAAEAALQSARKLQQHSGALVVISGVTDYICSADACLQIKDGNELLTLVTAIGCTLNAIIAACLAVCREDTMRAAATALTIVHRAAFMAAAGCAGPGSFRVKFVDKLKHVLPEHLDSNAKNRLVNNYQA